MQGVVIMAHLKAYLNGTPGGTDGIEITDETTIKGIMTNSQAANQGYGAAYVPICFRCEEGFKATNAVVKSLSNCYCLTTYYGYSSSCNDFAELEKFKTIMDNCHFVSQSMYGTAISEIGSTNVMMLFIIDGKETDSSALTDLFSVSYVEDVVA